MPRPNRRDKGKYSPKTEEESFKQSLYGELTTPEAMDEALREEEKKAKKKEKKGFYFWLYDFTEKHFTKKSDIIYAPPEEEDVTGKKKKKKKELPKTYVEAFDFLGWKLKPNVVMSMPKAAGIIFLILGVVLAGVVYGLLSYSPPAEAKCGDGICDDMRGEDATTCPADCGGDIIRSAQATGGMSPIIMLFIMFIPIFLTLGIVTYVQKYPMSAANSEKMRALTYVPEIMNYMVMQMRLRPNLERAVSFAAEHGEGKIAEEFKDLLWKNQVGIYDSIEEGLDDMAYRWEPYSEEFKHAITMIRASVLVPSDVERGMLYDKALEDLLQSTKEKMEVYAQSMKQPSMYLFYIAVLLPLMIIIMLPVAAAFAGIPVASTAILATLYLFILPLITYFYAKMVLSKRPGGYIPPIIPEDHPELPKKGTVQWGGIKLPVVPVAILLVIVIFTVGLFLDSGMKKGEQFVTDWEELHDKKFDQPSVMQFVIPLTIAIPLGFYLFGISVNKRKVQEKIFRMEMDFKDVMYLLASRLAEKKPMEDSIKYVKKFMPESKVATELLENVERNIMVLGLTLKSAIFDPTYGAMKYVPSRLITSSFKIMVDSIELGPEVASVSLIAVSDQIRNVQKINDLMRKLLDDVTNMMSSMARFIAPVVLGIVASLQKVIIDVIGPLTGDVSSDVGSKAGAAAVTGAESALGGGISISAIDQMATPFEFQLIVGLYVLILVTILSYFAGKIRYGDNRTAIMMTMGSTLPVSILVFVAALYMGGGLVGRLGG